jgi:hypothetical protein
MNIRKYNPEPKTKLEIETNIKIIQFQINQCIKWYDYKLADIYADKLKNHISLLYQLL